MLAAGARADGVPRLLERLPSLSRPALPGVVSAASAAVYLAVAVVVTLQSHLIVGDAWSRVGNAYYVLFSRDPHLAAIGFVWNPLPSLLEMPLVLARALWPPLVTVGFAGNFVSIVAMALAIRELWKLMGDLDVPRPARLGLTLLFALHPMIVSYGANGDTEALFILFLLIATRQLMAWLRAPRTAALAMCAIALALAYLVRYEAAAVAIAVTLVVAGVGFARAHGTRRRRAEASTADVLISMTPFGLAFVGWSLASWIIVGNPFEQFSSVYGTASQLAADRSDIFYGTGQGTPAAFAYVGAEILGLEPLVAFVSIIALAVAWARRDPRILAVLATFGTVLAFAAVAFLTGRTGGWLRYYITVVPFATICAGIILAGGRSPRSAPAAEADAHPGTGRWSPTLRRLAVSLPIMGALALALPISIFTMFDPSLGRGEASRLGDLRQYLAGADVAAYIDQMPEAAVPRGSVLLDTFIGFPIILQSDHPERFVITPDRDFKMHVADPKTTGIRYVLVPPSAGLASLDAIKRQWPGIYESGGGIGRLVMTFPPPLPGLAGGDAYSWRLYEVVK